MRPPGQPLPHRLFATATLGLLASLAASVGCGPPPPPSSTQGTCEYDVFEGTCQLLSVDDFSPPKSPGDIRARYVTRGAAPGRKPETVVLRYQVDPRYHHMAKIHLQSNPILRCGVSEIKYGDCKPVVTTLKIPEMPGGAARGELSLEPH